jgi:very-short-patch-repair endonuclease
LNVLFTRARNRVVLFSSMLAEDILVQPSSQWGVRALKGYLHFAQTGHLDTASFSGREPDSDFEVEVCEALRGRGYDAVAQVGVAGYFIDLAVRHPAKRDAFLLGVECDGATYHSGLSARDRDRLRQQVLEGLGWKIHRIWSTDWFKQPKVELDRMVALIERLLREERVSALDEAVEQAEMDESGPELDLGSTDQSTWEGEVSAQPLTEEDARRQLEALRDEIEVAFPDSDRGEALLREEMIHALLRAKPRSRDDWLRKIPFDLRFSTNGDELELYLGRVLEITQRFAVS